MRVHVGVWCDLVSAYQHSLFRPNVYQTELAAFILQVSRGGAGVMSLWVTCTLRASQRRATLCIIGADAFGDSHFMVDVQHTRTQVSLGIGYIMAGVLCLTISDSLAKWLGATYSPVQLLFLRGLLATPVLVVLVVVLGGRPALRTRHLDIHLLRGFLNVVSASCFYLSLTMLPLAEVTAIAFSAPLLVAIISVVFLDEKVSLGGWGALLVGFAGVLLIVRPSPQHMPWAAMLPLITALGYAVMMVSARRINVRESMPTTMLYIALGQVFFAGLPQAWVWEPVQTGHFAGFMGLAIFSTLGLGLITQAFRVAPASIVAPFDYSGLIWATLLGWLIWHEAPSFWFYAGAFLITAGGVYIALLQRPKKKAKAVPYGP